MLDKLNTYSLEVYFLFISLLFGTGSFLSKVRKDELKFTRFNYVSEIFFAALAGYVSFKLGLYFNTPLNLLGVFVGISSYSGTRFLSKLEALLNTYIDDKFVQNPVKLEIPKEEPKV